MIRLPSFSETSYSYRSYVRCIAKIGGCMHFFQSYKDFKNGDPRRLKSPEYDFSCMWHREGKLFERWRLSYILDTGEIYAVSTGYCFKDSVLCVLISKQPTLSLAQEYMKKAMPAGEFFGNLVLNKAFPFIDWDKVDELKNV